MVLHLLEGANPCLGILEDALIDEICGFCWVILVRLLYDCFDLLCHHLVPNLIFVFTTIRSLANHTLVRNDSKCKVVSSVAVVSVEHDLGSHVAGGARLKLVVVMVLTYHFVRNSKVR